MKFLMIVMVLLFQQRIWVQAVLVSSNSSSAVFETRPLTPEDLLRVDSIIGLIAKASPGAQAYVSGSTSRGLIESSLSGVQLKARDLDLHVVPRESGSVPRDLLVQLLKDLNIKHKSFSNRLRVTVYDGPLPIDIIYYPSLEESVKRSIFDIDSIRVDITKGLADTMNSIRNMGYSLAQQHQLIVDPSRFYLDYANKSFRVYKRDRNNIYSYEAMVMRASRIAVRIGLDRFPADLIRDFERLRGELPSYWSFNILLRILSESPERSIQMLKLLSSVDGIDRKSKEFYGLLRRAKKIQLIQLLSRDSDPKSRLRRLLTHLSSTEEERVNRKLDKHFQKERLEINSVKMCRRLFSN